MNTNHYQVVSEALEGTRAADEQVMASLEILSERLERLQKMYPAFEGVSFSAEAARLLKQKKAVAVC